VELFSSVSLDAHNNIRDFGNTFPTIVDNAVSWREEVMVRLQGDLLSEFNKGSSSLDPVEADEDATNVNMDLDFFTDIGASLFGTWIAWRDPQYVCPELSSKIDILDLDSYLFCLDNVVVIDVEHIVLGKVKTIS